MSTYQPHSKRVVKNLDDAVDIMVKDTFKRSSSLIGVEWEHLIVDPNDSFRMAGYKGKRGICEILKGIGNRLRFNPLYENGNIVGLSDSSGNIRLSLEPGGQIEWATKPVRGLYDLSVELSNGNLILEDITTKLGLAVMNLGLHPKEKPASSPLVPKERYILMDKALKKPGSLVRWMMQRTASIQVCLDICSRRNFPNMWKKALSALPCYCALMANSSEMAGKRNLFLSNRLRIWDKTDPKRCGAPAIFFKDNFSPEDYYRWAFKVPQLFVVREEMWIPLKDKCLNDAFEGGWDDIGPVIMDDIELHISTLFPEIRLKPFLEIRSGDSGNLDMCLAASAFWKGIIYGYRERIAGLDRKTFNGKFISAYKHGLKDLYEEARLWVKRAKAGLINLSEDTHYLDPFERIIYLEGRGRLKGHPAP